MIARSVRNHKLLLAMLLIVCIVSCAPGEDHKDDAVGKKLYKEAKVKLILDGTGEVVNRSIVIADVDTVAKLAAFFPELHTGRKSREQGSWIAHVQITFELDDNTSLVVKSNYESYRVGARGDMPTVPGLQEFVAKLFDPSSGK